MGGNIDKRTHCIEKLIWNNKLHTLFLATFKANENILIKAVNDRFQSVYHFASLTSRYTLSILLGFYLITI